MASVFRAITPAITPNDSPSARLMSGVSTVKA